MNCHRTAVIATSGVLALALTGGAIAFVQATATEKSVSDCFTSASLDARSTGVATVPENGIFPEEVPAMQDRVALAEEMYGAVWRIGFFESDAPPADDSRQYAVPSLTTCVLADGRLGVFPASEYGNQTCAILSLRDPEES